MTRDPVDREQLLKYREEGYLTVEGLFTADEIEGVRREITAIMSRYPNAPEELVQIEPSVAKGERIPESVELGVRKLFRMAKHNDFFRRLAFHPKMVEIAIAIVGPEVDLAQSMLLMKPPGIGGSKIWHQDNAYFRLEPNDVFGFWVACDQASVENGCMHVVPGSHRRAFWNTVAWLTTTVCWIRREWKMPLPSRSSRAMDWFSTAKCVITPLRTRHPSGVVRSSTTTPQAGAGRRAVVLYPSWFQNFTLRARSRHDSGKPGR